MNKIDALLDVMKALRQPATGCPWDIKQTHTSIAAYTLEETHELLEAIETNDMHNLREELGDLLFHVVFHSRIAEENGDFDFYDVVETIVEKMIYRHPHVFDDEVDNQISEEHLNEQWQALKLAQKNNNKPQLYEGESNILPAMHQASNIQQNAADTGFDWPHIRFVLDKLDEEIEELKLAITKGEKAEILAELGDVLFVCVNIARHTRLNAEMALRQTNHKFKQRFSYVQSQMAAAGIAMTQQQLDQMELFWQESKSIVG